MGALSVCSLKQGHLAVTTRVGLYREATEVPSHTRQQRHRKRFFRREVRLGGQVEVFELTGHPEAKRSFAWAHADWDSDNEALYVTVLEIPPPVNSLLRAVQLWTQ